jgi:glyoxylase-like metal-dependent hydrolase (beta-lactamase superfamily II)
MNGFPHDELKRARKSHPGYKYRPRGRLKFYTVGEGETISVGDYSFECIETPGHTKGHMCLYEPNTKLFISGDHILNDITPVVSSWFNAENPLDEYLVSLRKVYDLDVNLVLPGHRSTFQNFKARIQELEHHHQVRANEVLSILERGKQNAFQVASQMSWDMNYESWTQFPSSQKWFAAGEALAHLEYLKGRQEIQEEIRPQGVLFSLK